MFARFRLKIGRWDWPSHRVHNSMDVTIPEESPKHWPRAACHLRRPGFFSAGIGAHEKHWWKMRWGSNVATRFDCCVPFKWCHVGMGWNPNTACHPEISWIYFSVWSLTANGNCKETNALSKHLWQEVRQPWLHEHRKSYGQSRVKTFNNLFSETVSTYSGKFWQGWRELFDPASLLGSSRAISGPLTPMQTTLHIHIYIYIFNYLFIHVYIYIYVCVYIHVCIYKYKYV